MLIFDSFSLIKKILKKIFYLEFFKVVITLKTALKNLRSLTLLTVHILKTETISA